jgi:hypothetical protein
MRPFVVDLKACFSNIQAQSKQCIYAILWPCRLAIPKTKNQVPRLNTLVAFLDVPSHVIEAPPDKAFGSCTPHGALDFFNDIRTVRPDSSNYTADGTPWRAPRSTEHECVLCVYNFLNDPHPLLPRIKKHTRDNRLRQLTELTELQYIIHDCLVFELRGIQMRQDVKRCIAYWRALA